MRTFKKGFGILEVLAAAVVLGFLIVGLTQLQKGNREAILRVRVRDAANNVAQQVIDSVAARGLMGIITERRKCDRENDKNMDLCKKHKFKRSLGEEKENIVGTEVDFAVEVNVDEKTPDGLQTAINVSKYDNGEHIFAKNIDVTVEWDFKGKSQSINLSAVVRK